MKNSILPVYKTDFAIMNGQVEDYCLGLLTCLFVIAKFVPDMSDAVLKVDYLAQRRNWTRR